MRAWSELKQACSHSATLCHNRTILYTANRITPTSVYQTTDFSRTSDPHEALAEHNQSKCSRNQFERNQRDPNKNCKERRYEVYENVDQAAVGYSLTDCKRR